MDRVIVDYVNKMELFSDEISKSIKYLNKNWVPDEPPVIMLFSQIGKAIVKIFPELNHMEKKSIFEQIENGMTSPNDELATVVATGLIEAIVTSTDDNQFLWKKIEVLLGKESKEHALAWKNFGQ